MKIYIITTSIAYETIDQLHSVYTSKKRAYEVYEALCKTVDPENRSDTVSLVEIETDKCPADGKWIPDDTAQGHRYLAQHP